MRDDLMNGTERDAEELQEVIGEIACEEAELLAALHADDAPGRDSPWAALVALGCFVMIAALQLFGWTRSRAAAPTLEQQEQGARAMLALAVQDVQQQQRETGSLPRRLSVADIPGGDAWSYQLLSPRRYRVVLVLDGVQLTFDSERDEPPSLPALELPEGAGQ